VETQERKEEIMAAKKKKPTGALMTKKERDELLGMVKTTPAKKGLVKTGKPTRVVKKKATKKK
jgi:hypothetical protein